jgi:hypothetical protein
MPAKITVILEDDPVELSAAMIKHEVAEIFGLPVGCVTVSKLSERQYKALKDGMDIRGK